MEKVLKVSEVSDGIDQLIKKKQHEQKQITHIKNALNNVVGLDEALKGEGGEAIRQNFSMVHMPVLLAFDQFIEQYIQQLKDIQNQVKSYESEDGIVREHFIEHDVNNGLDKIKSVVDASVKDINNHFSKVSDLVSSSNISSDQLDSEIHNTKQDNEDTVDNLNKLDHESKSGLEDSEDSLNQITQLVGKVKDWAKDGFSPKDLPNPAQALLNDAYQDLKNGKIDRDKYYDILSVVQKTKGDLSAEELNEKVPDSFIEYLKDNRDKVGRDLGINISPEVIALLGKGTVRLAGMINVLTGTRGPAGANSFVMENPKTTKATNPLIKNGNKVAKFVAGKAFGRSIIGVGFAVGMYDDLANGDKTVGEATTHNAAATIVGVGATEVTTAALTTVAAIVLGSNPVGWTAVGIAAAGVAVGVVATYGFNWLYDNNVLHTKDVLDYAGKGLDYVGKTLANIEKKKLELESKAINTVSNFVHHPVESIHKAKKTVSNIVHHPGQAIKSGLKSLNPFA